LVLRGDVLLTRKKEGRVVLSQQILTRGGKGKASKVEGRAEDAESLDWTASETKMSETVERFKTELSPLRVGRADTSLLDMVSVATKVRRMGFLFDFAVWE
jgi:hypothetical protein